LNAVLGLSRHVLDDTSQPLSEDQADSLDHVWRAGRHLLNLINDVLDFAKIEAGSLEVLIDDVDLQPMLKECVQLLADQATRSGITIELDPEPDLIVRADFTRLKQVALNLLSNAIKYNRPEGRVHVSVKPSGNDMASVTVRDTGQGMDAASLANLFQPFNRLGFEGSTVEGTGIGLVITEKLLQAMDGHIEVESEVGIGSAFTVHVPLAPLT